MTERIEVDDGALASRMPSVRNAIAVLRRLAGSTRPLSAGALSRTLNVPRSSMYQLLQVLIDEGLVVRLPEGHTYALGVGVFELGSAYLRHEPLEHLARPLLARLAHEVNEAAQLGILNRNETLYLLKEIPLNPTALVTEVGVRLPAHLTASGRSILAGLPFKQVLAYFSSPGSFKKITEAGPGSVRELRALLRADQIRGWALEHGNVTDGITCIAAAVHDQSGYPVACVTVSFRSERHAENLEGIAARVVDTADILTRRIGGSRPLSGS